jgi:hypothetical protein
MKGMKRKVMISSLLGISLCVILAFSMSLPAFADIGTDINSYWASTTPIINGILSPGEWADAKIVNFQFYMRSRTDGSLQNTLNAKLYVKNDYDNLYVAVQIFNDTYWAQDLASRYKGFAILFNNNDNGTLGQGENGEGITTWTGSPFYSKNDLYYDKIGGQWDSDVNIGKTNDGAISFTHTNPVNGALGNWTFEMSIPLVGSDVGYDFNIHSAQLPKEIGYKLWFWDQKLGWDGVYPDDPSINVNLDETFDAATFGDIIIHPLYYLTIVATTGGTTNPVPGTYPYGYGTEVSVNATASSGYTFDHWTLDTADVGATNPYTVLMNMNHTLKAFFKPVPRPVGGYSLSLADKASLSSVAGYVAIFGTFAAVTAIVKRKRK